MGVDGLVNRLNKRCALETLFFCEAGRGPLMVVHVVRLKEG